MYICIQDSACTDTYSRTKKKKRGSERERKKENEKEKRERKRVAELSHTYTHAWGERERRRKTGGLGDWNEGRMQEIHAATRCNTLLQHTAAYCSILQHTATYRNTLQYTAEHCKTISLWRKEKARESATSIERAGKKKKKTWEANVRMFNGKRGEVRATKNNIVCCSVFHYAAVFQLQLHFHRELERARARKKGLQIPHTLQRTATHCNTLQRVMWPIHMCDMTHRSLCGDWYYKLFLNLKDWHLVPKW